MKDPKKKKIIWAVDISQNPREVKNLIVELKLWAETTDSDVLPVAVYPMAILDVPLSKFEKRKQYLIQESKNDVRLFLRAAGAEGFLEPEVLLSSTASNRQMAQTLISYAAKQKATMIFANSHAKKLWNTFLIGGFALTLTSLSHIPVMLLTLKAKPSKSINSIIFPTDFSQESKLALDYLKPLAKSFNSNILLYNQIEDFNYLLPPPVKPKKALAYARIKKLKVERMHIAKSWMAKLTTAGINSKAIVKDEKRSLWSAVDSLARNTKDSIVALSSNGGPAIQSILGSVTRNIVASAKYPVLVFHEPRSSAMRRPAAHTKLRSMTAERTLALHS